MTKLRAVVLWTTLTLLLIAGAAFAAPPSATDAMTQWPVYPGLGAPDKLPKASYCGKSADMEMSFAGFNSKVKAADVVSWYASKLSGARHFRAPMGAKNSRSQDTYFSSDGLREVTITGVPDGDALYAVSFGRFGTALTPKEMASFNTNHQLCGK